ncbi:hypothetical protein [Rhizobium leguminosarum]|uniref:hypothetical protein n=1 Tax=Rhizobium leguminosarum TaxID=384 RepID=UPI001C9428BF|nr:hypothetical protein [Rhizobium leguminosarum]MBY5827692.1 hypothetical protein [Rhizobium leguminosarum]
MDDAAVEPDRLNAEAARSRRIHDKGFLSFETIETAMPGWVDAPRLALPSSRFKRSTSRPNTKRRAFAHPVGTHHRAKCHDRRDGLFPARDIRPSGYRRGPSKSLVAISGRAIDQVRAGETTTFEIARRRKAILTTVRLVHPIVGEKQAEYGVASVLANTDLRSACSRRRKS